MGSKMYANVRFPVAKREGDGGTGGSGEKKGGFRGLVLSCELGPFHG
jgi:hypothetical protein